MVKDNVVLCTFGQMELPILVDTGATLTMVSTRLLDALGPDLVPPITETSVQSATMADGQDIDILIAEFNLLGSLRNRFFYFTPMSSKLWHSYI